MNKTNQLIDTFFNQFISNEETPENEYNPKVKVLSTVYPGDCKRMSLNGDTEWYGLQEESITYSSIASSTHQPFGLR